MIDELSTREFDRRELLRRLAAVAAATSISRYEQRSRAADARRHHALFPGLRTVDRADEWNDHQRAEGRRRSTAPSAARRAAEPRVVAADRAAAGEGVHRGRRRSARLRRQRQAARRRRPRQLLEARDGARSGRGDEALRVRPVPGRRPRSRRARRRIGWRSIIPTR